MKKTEYFSKAECYHKYRWDYHPAAIDFIVEKAGLDNSSTILDVGAGTGILTKHFINRVQRIFAVEPDTKMFELLSNNLKEIIPIQQYSDFIPEIPDKSVNAIVAAHALHWFDFHKTLKEWNRIAAQNCLLFSLENRNISKNPLFSESKKLISKYKKQTIRNKQDFDNITSYFQNKEIKNISFNKVGKMDFEIFLGSLASISYLPSPSESIFESLKKDAEKLFFKYAEDKIVKTEIKTKVTFGCLSDLI